MPIRAGAIERKRNNASANRQKERFVTDPTLLVDDGDDHAEDKKQLHRKKVEEEKIGSGVEGEPETATKPRCQTEISDRAVQDDQTEQNVEEDFTEEGPPDQEYRHWGTYMNQKQR
jgi:hypothetical protein